VVWPFSEGKKPPGLPQKVPFKSGADFLEYRCKFGPAKIVPRQGIVALVLDSQKEFGPAGGGEGGPERCPDGHPQGCVGGRRFIVSARTPSGKVDRLKPGDVVIRVPLQHVGDALCDGIDRRFGRVGFIVAKVAPEMDMARRDFDILRPSA